MNIQGSVIDFQGAPGVGVQAVVTAIATAKVRMLDDDGRGHMRPRVITASKSSEPVVVVTDGAGVFTATIEPPAFLSEDGEVLGRVSYSATARALGSAGETLARAEADGTHDSGATIDVGRLQLPAPRPAFDTVTFVRTLPLGPRETRRFTELTGVGAGTMKIEAMWAERGFHPAESGGKPEPSSESHPAAFRVFPLEGSGAVLDGEGSGELVIATDGGGPRHVWVIEAKNPDARRRDVSVTVRYVSRRPIQTRPVSLAGMNSTISRVLRVGPGDDGTPPLEFLIGDDVKLVVREDWQQFFGTLSSLQLPSLVDKLEFSEARARPVAHMQTNARGQVQLVLNIAFNVGTISAKLGGGWIASGKATNLRAGLVLTLGVRDGRVVPHCVGFSDITVDAHAGLLTDLAALALPFGIVGLGLLPVIGVQIGAEMVAKYAVERIRKAVELQIPAAINARAWEYGAILSTLFAGGTDLPVLSLDFDRDSGNVIVTYVADESAPLPTLDPEAPDATLADKIDHVVVLMMENRSFDHMLGYLERDKGRTDVDGLNAPDERGNTGQWNQFGGEQIQPFKLHSTKVPVDVDPCHRATCVGAQIGPNYTMTGFVESFAAKLATVPGARSKPQDVMGYHGAEHVWAYDAIAENFAICDQWFSSHPGPTWPNRFFMISAHLGPSPDGGPDVEMTGDPKPVDLVTIFDVLTERGISWRYFEHDIAFLRKVARYTLDFEHVVPIDDKQHGLFRLAADGQLPSVTFIDPNFDDVPDNENPEHTNANDDHPPVDIAPGQQLVARIYNALRASPNWERTLFIITYDEHGGLYDHCQPPSAQTPPGSKPTLGVRVPALVVSPWVPPGSVSHDVFDHTVVAKTIFRRFAPEAMPDLSNRFRDSPSLASLLTLGEVRRDALVEIVPPISTPKPTSERASAPLPPDPDDTLRASLRALRVIVDAQRPGRAPT